MADYNYYIHVLRVAAQNLLFGQTGSNQETKAGDMMLTRFSRAFAWQIFGANLTSYWRHSYRIRAIWPGQRQSCV